MPVAEVRPADPIALATGGSAAPGLASPSGNTADAAATDPRADISAMIGLSGIPLTASAGTGLGGGLQWVDIDRIKPNPLQPRKQFVEERLEELASSIRSSGILQPVIVRRAEDGYTLIAGERRWRAAQRAGLLKVPALIRDIPDNQVLEVALIENLQRESLNPMEEAHAYAALIEDFGMTQAEVAERVGRQRPTVANSLRLLTLSPRVQSLIEGGSLTMGHAKALASLPNHKAQEFGAKQIVSRGLSVREAELWVSRHTEIPEPVKPSPRDPNVGAAELNLQRRLGTRVRIVSGRGEKGRILIEYYSSAELDRIYERLAKA